MNKIHFIVLVLLKGLLLLQQRGHRGQAATSEWRQANSHRRLGRAPWK